MTYGTAIATGTSVSVNCSPVSGAAFPVGATAVVCTATDSVGRSAACSFTITVQSALRISLTRFAAFGDSITWGEDGTDFCNTFVADSTFGRFWPHKQLPTAQQYPAVLAQLLQARYTGQTIRVEPLGKQGEAAAEALNRFQTLVIAPRAYDAVLLMEGANDINRLASPSGGIIGLRVMIETAKSNNVRPFLATIPPEIPSTVYTLDPAAVRSFNNSVRSLAAFENVTLVDVEAAFGSTPGNYISCDGLHPNAEGYRIIANAFFNVLVQTLQTSATLSPAATPGRTTSVVPAPARPRSPARPRP